MNYRHAYHAGNFADIFKHLILTMSLGYLQNKDKGLFILDAFAGCGLYDLNSDAARKTNEKSGGIEAFMNFEFFNADLVEFQTRLKPFRQLGLYPGSPLLIAERLRPQDRLHANELHPEDIQELKRALKVFRNSKVLQMDAYECIRSSLPPVERRGLILVDPPFERKDEFNVLGQQLREWIKRWNNGCYIIWYPIKADSAAHYLFDTAIELDVKNIFVSEFLLHSPNTPDNFNGCGVMIINAPFQIPERINDLSLPLCEALRGYQIKSEWLMEN